jgi:hypothetical protein
MRRRHPPIRTQSPTSDAIRRRVSLHRVSLVCLTQGEHLSSVMLTAGPAARSDSLHVSCRGETTRGGHKGRSTANRVGEESTDDPGRSRGLLVLTCGIQQPPRSFPGKPEGVTGYYARTAWLLDLCRDGGRIIGDESPSCLSHNHWAHRLGGRYGHTQPSIRARLPHRGSIAQDRLTDAAGSSFC